MCWKLVKPVKSETGGIQQRREKSGRIFRGRPGHTMSSHDMDDDDDDDDTWKGK